jgi:hypothetical protein
MTYIGDGVRRLLWGRCVRIQCVIITGDHMSSHGACPSLGQEVRQQNTQVFEAAAHASTSTCQGYPLPGVFSVRPDRGPQRGTPQMTLRGMQD